MCIFETPSKLNRLTHFLKDIFIGNSYFALLGNIRRPKDFLIHSLNTLNFVSIAKSVKTNPQINFEAREHKSQLALSDFTGLLNGLGVKGLESEGRYEDLTKELNKIRKMLSGIISRLDKGLDILPRKTVCEELQNLFNVLDSTNDFNNETENVNLINSIEKSRDKLTLIGIGREETLIKKMEEYIGELKRKDIKFENILKKKETKIASRTLRNYSPMFGKSSKNKYVSQIEEHEIVYPNTEIESDKDFSTFLRDNFEKDKSVLNEERLKIEKIE